jgi:methionyl-tRNA synthetase
VAQHCIGEAALLFTKIENAQIEAQLQKLKDSKAENNEELNIEAQKPNIPFKDFSKMDFRVGTVVAAEKMPKTKKLLVLKVDIGDEVRTIVSGIAMDYAASEVLGQKVTVLCNLKPRILRGIESQGMILMGKSANGALIFVEPDSSLETISGLNIS